MGISTYLADVAQRGKEKKNLRKKYLLFKLIYVNCFHDFTKSSKYSVSIYDKGTPWLTRT